MKFKKKLSLICIIVLLCNLFAVIPVNAFTNITSVSDTWTASNNIVPNWRFDSTVDGFDDYVHIDSRFAIRTNITYDLNTTKLLINSLEIPSGYYASVMITPDGRGQNVINPDVTKGEICLLLKKSSSGELIVNRKEGEYEYGIGVYAAADTYELEFTVKTDVKYVNHSPKYTNEYMFSVNGEYVSSTDTSSWLYTFCSSSVFKNAYIAIGTYNYVKANLKICDKDTFVAANTNGLCYDSAADSDGYQSVYAEASLYTLTSSTAHNMFEETLDFKSISWNESYDAAILLNFSNTYRFGETSLLSNAANLGLKIYRDEYGYLTVYVNKHLSGQTEKLVRFAPVNPLKITFISDGAGGYGISFNGYYCENSYITKFLKANENKKCYVSLSAEYSFGCDVKFQKADKAVWVSDNSIVKSNVNDEGETVYSLSGQNSLTTAKKYNALENTVIMENTYFGTEQRLFMLGFSTTHIGTERTDDGANGKLIFDIYSQNASDGSCTGLRVHKGMSTQLGHNVAPAESYYISLCNVDGTYYLKINGRMYTNDSVQAFCENYADSVYISVTAYNSTMKYSLDVWDKGPGYTLSSSSYTVTEDTVSSVEAYTSASDILNKIEITEGYEMRVTTADGEDRTFADLLATEDKLVISYKERDVGSFDIAVGGELTGDTDVIAEDITLLCKQLLDVGSLTGIYETATDVNNDGKLSVIDFISAKKKSVNNINKKHELLSLVDFAVEVESGREPIVLQLTDTMIIDAAQARSSELLSDYQTEFWATDKAEERCYSYIKETVENANPDLIIITGNMVYGEFDDNGTAFKGFVEFMDSLDIPWAPVFSEHDNESAMGVDWQCDVLENAENCLFKQRTLTGNGNYSVGIMQNNKLLRIFYMLDTNGCTNASKTSLANNHTRTSSGLAFDQINWLEKLMDKAAAVSPDTKLSLAYGIPQQAFIDAFEKYGFTNENTKRNHINLNKTPECAEGDFGYIGADINNSWDKDNSLLNILKNMDVDLVLSGGESASSASVMMDGIRFQYGQKSSAYGYYNNVTDDGTVMTLYPEENNYTALIGGTVIPVSYMDGSITNPYIYYCDNAGGDINWDKAVTLNVADFGAVGDGVTDDGNAVYDALEAFMKCGAGSKLVFENKTYYISDNSERHIRALNFKKMYNSSVEGNGATILAGGETVFMTVNGCVDFEINDLNFDRKIRSHFVAEVTAINLTEGYLDIVSDRDFGFNGEYVPEDSIFGFSLKNGLVKRNYIYIDKLTTLDADSLKYRFYPDMDESVHNTATNIKNLSVGDSIVLPTPNIGHCLEDGIIISENSDLTLKNVNVLNCADFVFVVSANTGKLTFDNVNIAAPADETTQFVTWRDGFHCKGNKDSIIWKNCKAMGLGDDIINISANLLNVKEVISNNEIICNCSVTGGSYGIAEAGDSVVIYDADTGKLIAETTVKEVVNQRYNHYILNDSVPSLTAGDNIRVYFDNHAAPDSQLINCDFEGTLRFKGAGGKAENCKLSLYAMVVYPEDYREGPIPHDITFSNCDFTGTSTGRIEISCLSPVTTWQEGYYRLENIRFENCTGLTKSLFKYKNNFVEGTVDYITVTPAIS